jgi:hypothetical protein
VLLDYYWSSTGVLFEYYWNTAGVLMECYLNITGVLLWRHGQMGERKKGRDREGERKKTGRKR